MTPLKNKKKVKVCLIGCGQIAEAHLKELSLSQKAEVAGVCDLKRVLAEDLADRFGITGVYSDYTEMLKTVQPDVVHITTPPHTQLRIGLDAIRNGCHVYIEKPFGTCYQDAEKLIETAKSNQKIACAGFSQLQDTVSMKFNAYLESGELGEIVHFETYYGDSLEGNFSRLFLQNKDHWIHGLPGKMFQNVISHALYHVAPFVPDELEEIRCVAYDRSKNGVFQDELRVVLRSGGVTGYLTYTTAVRPIRQFLRVYGTKSIVEIDFANHVFWSYDGTDLPGPVARARNVFVPAKRLIKEGFSYLCNTLTGKDRFFSGMGNLFDLLYDHILSDNSSPPVPYADVLKTSRIMDEIARQCSEIELQIQQVKHK